jgi:DNA-directed RNA polymerase subunit RPC12/RpoP
MIGEQRRQMKWDTEYRCNNCGAVLKTPPTPPRPTDADNRDP